MVEYSDLHNAYMATAFPKRVLVNTLGEWVSAQGLTQFRLAETEKYPHVTFFLNGGREAPYPGEDRAMPASPKVATYDLHARDERGPGVRPLRRGHRKGL
jgi:2,3-bisphosphoglycerate-independent phosphoglycerate mutase